MYFKEPFDKEKIEKQRTKRERGAALCRAFSARTGSMRRTKKQIKYDNVCLRFEKNYAIIPIDSKKG